MVEIDRNVEPWPNGTPNSSQLEPGYEIKTCIGGWPNGIAKSSQLARKPFNFLTTTAHAPKNNKKLGESWQLSRLELAKRWKT